MANITANGDVVWLATTQELDYDLYGPGQAYDWTDWDISSYVSAAAKLAILGLRIKPRAWQAGGTASISVRCNGHTPTYYPYLAVAEGADAIKTDRYDTVVCGLDSNRILETKLVVTGAATTADVNVRLLGYIE
jgi:hypothetical protein